MGALDLQRIETASLTDPGQVRSQNQDRCAEFRSADGGLLLVVADGMGGHRDGDRASLIAVERIGEVFAARGGAPEDLLAHAFADANARVLEAGAGVPGGIGTTVVAVLIRPEGAWVAHVGDSRAYRWREGALDRLTDDHSWVFQEVAHGRMTPGEAASHPRRNALVRSIGMESDAPAEVRSVDLAPGDRLLLCSDGLWDELDEATLGKVLGDDDPDDCVRRLIELANLAGGHDNVTAALALVRPARRKPAHRLLWTALAAFFVVAGVARWCGT